MNSIKPQSWSKRLKWIPSRVCNFFCHHLFFSFCLRIRIHINYCTNCPSNYQNNTFWDILWCFYTRNILSWVDIPLNWWFSNCEKVKGSRQNPFCPLEQRDEKSIITPFHLHKTFTRSLLHFKVCFLHF